MQDFVTIFLVLLPKKKKVSLAMMMIAFVVTLEDIMPR